MIPGIQDIIGLLQFFQGIVDAFLIMVSTPDNFTFGLKGIQPLWQAFSVVANLLLVVFLMVGMTQIIIGRSTGSASSSSPQELITKFAVHAIAVNASFFLIHTLVGIENDLCLSLLAFTGNNIGNQLVPNGNVAQFFLGFFLNIVSLQNIPTLATGVPLAILAIIGIVFVVVLLVVFFQAVVRILRLNLFLVLSPLAFLFLMLEQTREYGSFMLRMLVITIFVQFVQVLSFCLALFLLTSVLIGGAFDNPVIKIALAIGQLIGIFNVPNLLAHFGLESNASRVIQTTILAARIGLKLAGVPVP